MFEKLCRKILWGSHLHTLCADLISRRICFTSNYLDNAYWSPLCIWYVGAINKIYKLRADLPLLPAFGFSKISFHAEISELLFLKGALNCIVGTRVPIMHFFSFVLLNLHPWCTAFKSFVCSRVFDLLSFARCRPANFNTSYSVFVLIFCYFSAVTGYCILLIFVFLHLFWVNLLGAFQVLPYSREYCASTKSTALQRCDHPLDSQFGSHRFNYVIPILIFRGYRGPYRKRAAS